VSDDRKSFQKRLIWRILYFSGESWISKAFLVFIDIMTYFTLIFMLNERFLSCTPWEGGVLHNIFPHCDPDLWVKVVYINQSSSFILKFEFQVKSNLYCTKKGKDNKLVFSERMTAKSSVKSD